jgi:predicted nucleic acid-binding protein
VTSFVIDASVAMAWCFEDEATRETDALLEVLGSGVAIVPALWQLEVANVLVIAERRRRISEAKSGRFLALLARLPIEVDDIGSSLEQLVSVARRHGLSAYDAAYLALAQRRGLPLATRDEGLREACVAAGVEVLPA